MRKKEKSRPSCGHNQDTLVFPTEVNFTDLKYRYRYRQHWLFVYLALGRYQESVKFSFGLTIADFASLANTNCPIRSFSSRWMQRAANSQSDLPGVHDPQRKAHRTEPISSPPAPPLTSGLLHRNFGLLTSC